VGADHHARPRLFGGEAGAHREAAANALGAGEDVGLDAVMLVGVELAGARDAALHLVESEHEVVLVAKAPEAGHEFLAGGADAALPLHRLDEKAGGGVINRSLRRGEIVELDHLKTFQQGCEAVAQLGLIGGADRRHGAAVKGVGEGDQLVLVRIAMSVVVAPRSLDGALDRLGTRIGEEHGVGKGEIDQPLRQLLTLRVSRRGWRRGSASPPAPGSPWSAPGGRGRAG
jgi:hypothetical protein